MQDPNCRATAADSAEAAASAAKAGPVAAARSMRRRIRRNLVRVLEIIRKRQFDGLVFADVVFQHGLIDRVR